MTTPAILVQDLSYRYRTRETFALRRCTFSVQPGELVLVTGASGCGKTTLMRCLNGLIPRSYKGGELSGTIRLLGKDPTPLKLADISRMVGTVLQDPEKQIVGAYVLNEVAFGLENLGLPRDEILRRVDEILEFMEIAHLRDRPTFALSGGEKQKVTIAGVLVMEPDIVLLDEPLANLDAESAAETLHLVRRLVEAGKTVVLIEHRIEEALAAQPDLALFLEEGEQLYFGHIEGFLNIADPFAVKLPAPVAVKRLRDLNIALTPPPRRARRPEAEPLVMMEDIWFGYEPDQPVVRGVTLDIRPGDVIALLGPNGAGKSTLVRQIIGLQRPQQGRVMVAGQDTRSTTVAQIARTVGYVFQSPTHMLFAPTVWEELAFGPRNLGFDEARIERNVRRSLEIVNLQGYEHFSPLALSYGQQRRVGIGAILAMESRVLIMDEPTAGQDYRHYTRFMDAVVQMPFEAIVFITHDVDLAVRYANRVILMAEGRIEADGTPEEVLSDFERLQRCRIRPTSLLELNMNVLPQTGRFCSLEEIVTLGLPVDGG